MMMRPMKPRKKASTAPSTGRFFVLPMKMPSARTMSHVTMAMAANDDISNPFYCSALHLGFVTSLTLAWCKGQFSPGVLNHTFPAATGLGSPVPGADDTTPLLAVSRSGTRVSSLTAMGLRELLDAWR